jgi:hypothetical protein
MATQQIEEYSVLGSNLNDLLAQYKGQKIQASENKLTTDILGAGELHKLTSAFTKAKTSIEAIPEKLEKFGNLAQTKYKELSNTGENILETGKKSMKDLLNEGKAQAKDIVSMGKTEGETMVRQGVKAVQAQKTRAINSGHEAYLNFRNSPSSRVEKMQESAFNKDPEWHDTFTTDLKDTKSELKTSGEDLVKSTQSKISGLAEQTGEKLTGIGKEAISGAKAAVETAGKDLLAGIGEAAEPLIGLAEAIGLGASVFGMKAPSMPQPSLGALQVL